MVRAQTRICHRSCVIHCPQRASRVEFESSFWRSALVLWSAWCFTSCRCPWPQKFASICGCSLKMYIIRGHCQFLKHLFLTPLLLYINGAEDTKRSRDRHRTLWQVELWHVFQRLSKATRKSQLPIFGSSFPMPTRTSWFNSVMLWLSLHPFFSSWQAGCFACFAALDSNSFDTFLSMRYSATLWPSPILFQIFKVVKFSAECCSTQLSLFTFLLMLSLQLHRFLSLRCWTRPRRNSSPSSSSHVSAGSRACLDHCSSALSECLARPQFEANSAMKRKETAVLTNRTNRNT